jgi:hypothetical protein
MFAVTKNDAFSSRASRPSVRQYTPRAALGFWFAASVGGWLLIGGVLHAVGIL